jgi:hypothetical protein
MQSVLDDPNLWHDCAADACVAAEQMIDKDSKRVMLGIADGYRQLASRSNELRAKERPKNSRSGIADRLRAKAHEAKLPRHRSFTQRGGRPRNPNDAGEISDHRD